MEVGDLVRYKTPTPDFRVGIILKIIPKFERDDNILVMWNGDHGAACLVCERRLDRAGVISTMVWYYKNVGMVLQQKHSPHQGKQNERTYRTTYRTHLLWRYGRSRDLHGDRTGDRIMYCPEVAFFFQFTSFMMLMVSVLVAVGWAWYYDRYFVKKQDHRIKRRRYPRRRR